MNIQLTNERGDTLTIRANDSGGLTIMFQGDATIREFTIAAGNERRNFLTAVESL